MSAGKTGAALVPKEWRPLLALAEKQGWEVYARHNRHLAWRSPTGDIVYSSSTPSDRRALYRHTAIMRRYGLRT